MLAAVVPGGGGTVPAAVVTVVLAVVAPAGAALAVERLLAGRWLEAAEVAVLLALVLLAPPFAASGVWFGCRHSVRHVARVVADDPGDDPDALRRFAVAAALPTAAVLAVGALLWSAGDGWTGLVATALPLLAALTLPHALVVAWLDRTRTGVTPG